MRSIKLNVNILTDVLLILVIERKKKLLINELEIDKSTLHVFKICLLRTHKKSSHFCSSKEYRIKSLATTNCD